MELDHNAKRLPRLHSYKDIHYNRKPIELEPFVPTVRFDGTSAELVERTFESFEPSDCLLFALLHKFHHAKKYDLATASRNLIWLFTFVFDSSSLREVVGDEATAALRVLSEAHARIEIEEVVEFTEDEIAALAKFMPVSRAIWQGGVDFVSAAQDEWVMESCAPMTPYYARDCAEDDGWLPVSNPFLEHFLQSPAYSVAQLFYLLDFKSLVPKWNPGAVIDLYQDLAYKWAEAANYVNSVRESIANNEDYVRNEPDYANVDYDEWIREYYSQADVTPLRSLMNRIKKWYRQQRTEDAAPPPIQGLD